MIDATTPGADFSAHNRGTGRWPRARFALVLLLFAATACAPPAAKRVAPRHVVLLSLDTTRADHIGYLGSNVHTPCLDSLAGESIVFTRYFTVVPSTLASHVSLFTGMYPHHHGAARNGFLVNPENRMLPEILKEDGYMTAGFAGSFALDRRFGFAQGFDEYDESFDQLVTPGGADQNQRSATAVTDAVGRYLDRAGIPEHLFLFVHYFDPHWPYTPPAPFDTMYDPLGRTNLPPIAELMGMQDSGNETQMGLFKRHSLQYAGEISYMDQQIGRLLRDLRRRGILDDAILLVTSDHGESFWEHGEIFGHGATTYQPTVAGVGLIRLPGAELAGTRWSRPVASIDVLPTLLRLLGLRNPSVDGEAIDLRVQDEAHETKRIFGQATQPWKGVETDPNWANMNKSRFVLEGDYKFIQTPYRSTEELYDLAADPGERQNLVGDPSAEIAGRVDRQRRVLEEWAASATPLASTFEPAQQRETIMRLRSLGYMN